MSPDTPPGAFSLEQAGTIADAAYCPYCGWKRGTAHPILLKPWCVHQFLAGEIIAWHRKVAEQNVTSVKASEVGA